MIILLQALAWSSRLRVTVGHFSFLQFHPLTKLLTDAFVVHSTILDNFLVLT